MSDYIIATSSTSDLPRAWLEEHNVPFIAYSYTVNDEVREEDCREESRAAVYAEMGRGASVRTSQITEAAYHDFLKGLLDTGKDVIFLDMSRKMSASYENCERACEQLRAEYPNRRLCMMDTRCISMGLGLLVAGMVRRMEAGESYDEVIGWGEANKLRIAHRFTVDNLKYLKMSGRVSNTSALVGALLSIKPVLYVSDGGTLDVVRKARGRKAAVGALLDGVLHDLSKTGASGAEIHVLHADCRADAEHLKAEIQKAYPQLGEVTISSLGTVIGAHCGPGLLAALYFCDGRCPE